MRRLRRDERGVVMPGVLILSFLVFSLLLHQAQLLLIEKRFYFEAEQVLILDNMMHRAVSDFRRHIHEQNDTEGTTVYEYEDGKASVVFSDDGRSVSVSVRCITNEGRAYKAIFQYNKNNDSIMNWIEERL